MGTKADPRTQLTGTEPLAMAYPFKYNTAMNVVKTIHFVAGMTQSEIAESADTSQPAIAAYEADAKSPTWRTIERIAGSVGLGYYLAVSKTFTRDQARSLALHVIIAQEVRGRRSEVLDIAYRNIKRMRSNNPHASALLEEWERILSGSTQQIVSRMLDPSEHGRDLRQVTPFAGVLSPTKRTAFYRSCQNTS